MKRIVAKSIAVVLLAAPLLFAQQAVIEELEGEIKRIRKELVEVQNERAKIAGEVEDDRSEFDEYRSRVLKRMREIQSETDSLRNHQIAYKSTRDSLQGVLTQEKNRQQQYRLQQESVRTTVMSLVDTMLQYTNPLPPTLREKPLSSLELLQNELSSKNVDNVEAVNRLFTIGRDMDNGFSTIQIVQGNSPIPEIRGITYRFRLGALFEGVVNAQGTNAAIWDGIDEQGEDNWKIVSDAVLASEILKAVNVREGKALPELITLPLDRVAVDIKGDVK